MRHSGPPPKLSMCVWLPCVRDAALTKASGRAISQVSEKTVQRSSASLYLFIQIRIGIVEWFYSALDAVRYTCKSIDVV